MKAMQAEATILERITAAYVAHRGVRLLCVLAALSAALLLFLLAGGFPPWAWRLLAQVLPRMSTLLALRGQAALLALAGLLLLSVMLLLAWGALLWLCWRMLAYWWYERQELRNFAADMEEAQYLAESEDEANTTHYPEPDPFENEVYEYQLRGSAGARNYSQSTRHGASPFAPLAEEELDEEDPYQGDEYDESEEENEMELYQDEGEDGAFAENQGAFAAAAATSLRPVRLVSAPTYDQQIIEHPGPGARPDNIQHSSYGRVMSFPPAPPVDALPHLTSVLYDRVPAPPVPSTLLPTAPLPATPLPLVSSFATKPAPAARQPALQLLVSTGLDVGLKRRGKPNEDSLLALQNTRIVRGSPCPVGLFVVADGMGGHDNGQEASRLVIQSLSKSVVPSVVYGPTDDNYAELLAEGVHHANLEVYQRNRQEKADMGTTIVAALVINTTAYVVSVGDSRAYLYRPSSGLTQVTRDHSTVARLVENGLIEPEEIYTHPRRNEIYRSLGHRPSEDLDKFILALQADDLLLLCSDGLWEMVRDSQIQQIIESTLDRPTQISAALVQAALEGGGKDNISVIVVYVKALEQARAAWAG
jgi:serine/threonine protein phosphatase PrpC